MALVETEIDGRKIEVERDRWALDVARDLGLEIPTLCYHPALVPYGACRLCVVEVSKGQATWLATSCDLPIREGLRIRTETPAVLAARRMTLELLWAAAPEATEIRALAEKLGVSQPRFADRSGLAKCILCGLCIRACQAILGRSAICFSRRGPNRRVGSPLAEASDTCTGCLACVRICPTGHIVSTDDGPVRRMTTWNTDLPLVRCERCGESFATVRELTLARAKLPPGVFLDTICADCRRSQTVDRLAEAGKHAIPRASGGGL
jgi:NADH dehydrogenase/NADH:ubiquinone oxidoreductase subunit G